MLKNIKSTYFIKLLFSYVNEKQKLKIVKFNKKLQNIINMSIINYKFFTGKYLIYESNGVGKEYLATNDELLFEGEYFHGERKGKGKEYYKLFIYEGEYLNGKRNGEGKEYFCNGDLKFEGEYLNGKKNGKGKEYNGESTLIFEGEYLNGKRNGKGKEYDWSGGECKLSFEGEYLNGRKWIRTRNLGKKKINIDIGREYDENGKLIFEGEYLNGKRNGKGKEYYYNGDLIFEGEYKNDLKWNGKGYDHKNKIVYELIDGKGLIQEYECDDDFDIKFEGEYLNGQRNGKGKEYDLFIGELSFEGEYLNGKRHGKGKEYKEYDNLRFEGEYLNGKRHGKGKEYYYDKYLKVNI